MDDLTPATFLITHYYTSILGRTPDSAGLSYWQSLIPPPPGDVKPVFRGMADFFFNSPEYLGSSTSNSQFITDLYRTFYQREPDVAGLSYWLGQLTTAGVSRNSVIQAFLYTLEFTLFMEELGF